MCLHRAHLSCCFLFLWYVSVNPFDSPPYFAPNYGDQAKIFVTCGFGWLVVLLTMASQALSPIVWLFPISIVLFIVCVTSFFVYFSIFLFARKRLRTVNMQDNFSNFLRDLKLAKTYVLIVSLTFICYLRYGISVIYYDIGIPVWLTMLLYTNSSLNSLFFFWMNRELRKGSKIIKKYFSTRDVG